MKSDINKDDFLGRWLADDLSKEEKKIFEDSKDYLAYKDILRGVERFDRPVFDIEKGLENQKEFNRTYQKLTKSKVIKLRTWLYSAAAVALVLFGLKIMVFNATTVRTDMAQNQVITLPDNSVVTLNADSSIKYDKNSFNEDRILQLNGQAFFDVAKGSKFTVQTKNGAIAVLGTEFDVYARDQKLQVHCFEGKVSVTKDDDMVILTPGMGVKSVGIEKLSLFDIKKTKSDWLTGKSSFKQVPLEQLVAELERQYNIEIITRNVDLKRIFTGFFTHSDIKQALKTSFEPMNINYKFINDKTISLENK